MDILVRIKRLVLHGQVRFTEKARIEMDADGLDSQDVTESIVNAQMIAKTLRSRSSRVGQVLAPAFTIDLHNR